VDQWLACLHPLQYVLHKTPVDQYGCSQRRLHITAGDRVAQEQATPALSEQQCIALSSKII
jgi:hypothetical protein